MSVCCLPPPPLLLPSTHPSPTNTTKPSNEYRKWREDRARLQRLRRDGRGDEIQFFDFRSLVFYPFVLSPHTKSRLLTLDAREQMRTEIEVGALVGVL